MNYFLVGMMGSGKSSVAQAVGSALGWQVVDMDALIEQREGMAITQIFQQRGEVAFRQIEQVVLQEVAKLSEVIISTGGGVMESEVNRQLMLTCGKVIYLQASPSTLWQRLKDGGHSTRPLLQHDNPLQVLEELLAKRQVNYQQADHTVATDGLSLEEVASKVLQIINNPTQ